IVLRDRRCDLPALFAEVLFVDSTVGGDDERHDPRGTVRDGIGDESETRGHLPADEIASLPAWSAAALRREDPEVVASPRRLRGQARGRGLARDDDRAEGAHVVLPGRGPVETVLLARRALELLCIYPRTAAPPARVFLLRQDV